MWVSGAMPRPLLEEFEFCSSPVRSRTGVRRLGPPFRAPVDETGENLAPGGDFHPSISNWRRYRGGRRESRDERGASPRGERRRSRRENARLFRGSHTHTPRV